MAVIIKDLLPPPRVVDIGGGKSISTHGIDLTQTIALLNKHKEPLSVFFGATNLDFTLLVAQAPDMVAEIIGMGVDAVGQEEDIKKFPVQAQVDILMEVWEQSVPNVKKLLASLERASASLAVARSTPAPLSTSSPESSTP
jgi:hypothetical protein